MAIINSPIIPSGRKSAGGMTFAKVRGNQVMRAKISRNRSNTADQQTQRTLFRAVQIFCQFWFKFISEYLPRTRHGSSWNSVLAATARTIRAMDINDSDWSVIQSAISGNDFNLVVNKIYALLLASTRRLWLYGKNNPIFAIQWSTSGFVAATNTTTLNLTLKISTRMNPEAIRLAVAGISVQSYGAQGQRPILAMAKTNAQLTQAENGMITLTATLPLTWSSNINTPLSTNSIYIVALQLRSNRKWEQFSVPMLYNESGNLVGLQLPFETPTINININGDVNVNENIHKVERLKANTNQGLIQCLLEKYENEIHELAIEDIVRDIDNVLSILDKYTDIPKTTVKWFETFRVKVLAAEGKDEINGCRDRLREFLKKKGIFGSYGDIAYHGEYFS